MNRQPKIIFDIEPSPAPRMTKSDKWKTDANHPDPKKRQRLCVQKYFNFREKFNWLCAKEKYILTDAVDIQFVIAMPETWSEKKKTLMDGKPHQSRPDVDNCLKSVFDSFGKDDGFVWKVSADKIWGRTGSILIY